MAALQPQGQGRHPRGQLNLRGSEAGRQKQGQSPGGQGWGQPPWGQLGLWGSGTGPASPGSARPAGVRGRADLPGFRPTPPSQTKTKL